MSISYDEAKRQANLAKHGIDLAECAPIFDEQMVSLEDKRDDYGEIRQQSLGLLHGQVVMLVWTDRPDSARLISCRKASHHETRKYFKEIHAF